MSLMSWLRHHFERSAPPNVQTAIDMASEVAMQAKSIREQLEPFRQEDDPFAAITLKRAMSQQYENDQEFARTPRAPT